jgi:hypothetical protein
MGTCCEPTTKNSAGALGVRFRKNSNCTARVNKVLRRGAIFQGLGEHLVRRFHRSSRQQLKLVEHVRQCCIKHGWLLKHHKMTDALERAIVGLD